MGSRPKDCTVEGGWVQTRELLGNSACRARGFESRCESIVTRNRVAGAASARAFVAIVWPTGLMITTDVSARDVRDAALFDCPRLRRDDQRAAQVDESSTC